MLKLLNGLDETTLLEIKKSFPKSNEEIIHISNNLKRGVVEFFGMRDEVDNLLKGVDPWTKQLWPDEHYKKIFFNPGHAPGDVKFLWEFMKHNFLPSVGKAYRLTGDEEHIKTALDFIKRWLVSIADDKGVSWAGHPHICQRMINWLLFLELAEGSNALTEEIRVEIDAYLDKQWALLEKEYHSPINNHKLLSLSFVILHRLYHNREDELDFWLQELKESIELLIYYDGGFSEQSISYHRFSVESLMLVVQGLKNAGLSTDSWLSSAIENSLLYFDAITQPNQQLPVFGDNSDEILLVREWPERFWDMEYLYAFGNALDLQTREAVSVPPSMYWVVGFGMVNESKKQPIRPKSQAFERTGHYVLRAGDKDESFVFFRAGEFGLFVPNNKSNHPHSHCDQLGVVAFLDGSEILTDPGTYRYNENDYERMIMKDESFHTTFKVNGKSQARYLSSFAYGDALYAEGRLENNKLFGQMGRDGWEATRQVQLESKRLIITDHIVGDVEVEWFFALSQMLAPIETMPGKVILKEVGSLRIIELTISEDVTAEILPGYISHQYDRAHASQRLYLKLNIEGEKTVKFIFTALGKELSVAGYR